MVWQLSGDLYARMYTNAHVLIYNPQNENHEKNTTGLACCAQRTFADADHQPVCKNY
jgi:hypothetical protein